MRTLHEIAKEIRKCWESPYFGAVPYLSAMLELETTRDRYGMDQGTEIVLYFLSNASSWRGEDARRIKKELRDML